MSQKETPYLDKFVKLLEDWHEEQEKLPRNKQDLCPPETPTELAFDVLVEMLLPKGYYTVMSMGRAQTNTELLGVILERHSKKFNAIKRKKRKEAEAR